MKILFLNTFQSSGGAAIATNRIFKALQPFSFLKTRFVFKYTQDNFISNPYLISFIFNFIYRLKHRVDYYIKKLLGFNHPKSLFSTDFFSNISTKSLNDTNPDIFHLFWINMNFISIEYISTLKKPIVWTLHDMWPMTGGCHYDNDCGRFSKSCGKCPLIDSNSNYDLSRIIWLRKKKFWNTKNITIVATSQWLLEMAELSSLFSDCSIYLIPNCIDTNIYKPIDKKHSRDFLGLSHDKFILLFSAHSATSDSRKGFDLLVDSLRILITKNSVNNIQLVVLGSKQGEISFDFNIDTWFIDHLNDEESQILLYSASDLTLAPSRQENLSNTVMESMACGTPVIAYKIGGMPDMVTHKESGYLAEPFNTTDFADGIFNFYNNKEDLSNASKRSREFVLNNFTESIVANKYVELYKSLIV